MKLSFATLGCPDWKIEDIAKNAKEMGFDGVELRGVEGEHIGPDESDESLNVVKKTFEDVGIKICAIMGYSKFTTDDQAIRQGDIDVARKFLDVAKHIDCPVLRVFGGAFSEDLDLDGNIERVAEGLKQVAEHAEATGVKIALETHDAWTQGANVKLVVDAVGSPMVGACWDVGNSFFDEPLAKTCELLGDRVFHVHFKDVGTEDDKHVSKLPGDGDVDLKMAMSLIKSSGYDGYLSFEWEKKWEPSLADPEVAFPHFLKYCRELEASL